MALIRLKRPLHDRALEQKICQSSDVERVQKVDFEKETVSHVVSVKRNTLDKGDMSDESRLLVMTIMAITHSQCMID